MGLGNFLQTGAAMTTPRIITRMDVAKINRDRVQNHVTANPGQTIAEIAAALKIDSSCTQQYCLSLRKMGLVRKVVHVRADGVASSLTAWAPGAGDDEKFTRSHSSQRATALVSHTAGQVHRVIGPAVQIGMRRMDCVEWLFGPARAEVRA